MTCSDFHAREKFPEQELFGCIGLTAGLSSWLNGFPLGELQKYAGFEAE